MHRICIKINFESVTKKTLLIVLNVFRFFKSMINWAHESDSDLLVSRAVGPIIHKLTTRDYNTLYYCNFWTSTCNSTKLEVFDPPARLSVF